MPTPEDQHEHEARAPPPPGNQEFAAAVLSACSLLLQSGVYMDLHLQRQCDRRGGFWHQLLAPRLCRRKGSARESIAVCTELHVGGEIAGGAVEVLCWD